MQGFGVVSGSVGNADRKCKAKTNFAACGQNLGEYTAKPNLPDLGTATGFKRVLKTSRVSPSIRFGWETKPTGPGNCDGIQEVFEDFKGSV